MPGVGVAYRDYTWSTFARHDNYTWSTFEAALSFAMALPSTLTHRWSTPTIDTSMVNTDHRHIDDPLLWSILSTLALHTCRHDDLWSCLSSCSCFVTSPLLLNLASHVDDVIMGMRLLTWCMNERNEHRASIKHLPRINVGSAESWREWTPGCSFKEIQYMYV